MSSQARLYSPNNNFQSSGLRSASLWTRQLEVKLNSEQISVGFCVDLLIRCHFSPLLGILHECPLAVQSTNTHQHDGPVIISALIHMYLLTGHVSSVIMAVSLRVANP